MLCCDLHSYPISHCVADHCHLIMRQAHHPPTIRSVVLSPLRIRLDDDDGSASRSVCRPASNQTLMRKTHTAVYNSESKISDASKNSPFLSISFNFILLASAPPFSTLQDPPLLPSIVLFVVFPQLLIRLIFPLLVLLSIYVVSSPSLVELASSVATFWLSLPQLI